MKCYTCKNNVNQLIVEGNYYKFVCKCNKTWIYVDRKKNIPLSDNDILRYNILFSFEDKSYMIDAEKGDEVCIETYNEVKGQETKIIFRQANFYFPLLLDDNEIID